MRRIIESDKKKQKMVKFILNSEYLNISVVKIMHRAVKNSKRLDKQNKWDKIIGKKQVRGEEFISQKKSGINKRSESETKERDSKRFIEKQVN
jgi:hypothetical protein